LSLCVLSIVSYETAKRQDLMQVLDIKLLEHIDRLISPHTSNNLIRARTAIFLSFYLDSLFRTVSGLLHSTVLEKIINFLYGALIENKENKVVALAALDALTV
jgi:hypothetical protein